MTTRHKGATSTHTTFYKGSELMRVKLADGEIRDINIGEIRSRDYYKPLKHER